MSLSSTIANRYRARITSQGQITVPKRVRDALRVAPGDELEFELVPDGAMVRPERRRSILEFAGIAGERSRLLPRTARELDELLSAANTARARRRSGR